MRTKTGAERSRGHAHQPPERVGQVALVREPRIERDLGERVSRRIELVAGELDATLSDVVPHRAPELAPELARKVHAVDTRRARERRERMTASELVVDLLLDALEPRQWRPGRLKRRPRAELGAQREHRALDRCRREIIA